MFSWIVIVLIALAFFEAVSRSGIPRDSRPPWKSLSPTEHLAESWNGLKLLGGMHEKKRRYKD